MPSTSSLGSRRNESSPLSHRSHRYTRDFSRPLSSRPYQPSTARSVNIIDNLDEILTQRSQVSMSQFNDSGEDSGGGVTIRRRSSSRLDRSITPPSSHHRRSLDQVALVGPNRATIPRRHSVNAVRRNFSTSSDSSSSYDGVLNNRRPASRRSMLTSVAPIQASIPDDDDKTSDTSPGGGFFSCMRCFKSSQTVERSIIISPPPTLPPTIFNNRSCQFVHKYLTLMSENLEADVLSNSSHFDSRLVFILFSLLSGDSLLTPQEFPDCDEWCDWLSLGFSDSSIEAFDRDINRNGCQTMGLLFQLFFAIQFPQIAKMCVIVIRNIHFTPSPLFGLFSVNCAKWTRDVLLSTIFRYDRKGPNKIPPLIDSAKFSFSSYTKFSDLFDWWISNGQLGTLAPIESSLMDEADFSATGGLYESFPDDDDETIPLSYRTSASPNRRVSFQPPSSRLPGIDRRSGDLELIKSVFTVGGLYYTYCILFFTKFWLEQKLIEVDADTARDRLNNQYLENSFVSKLELSSSMTVMDVEKRIEKLIDRIETLWQSSGWTKDSLLAN